jgi:hypothetical protein
VVVRGALGHHEHAQRLLLAVRTDRNGAGRDGTAAAAHRLEFGLHRPGRALCVRLIPLRTVELHLELVEFGRQPGVGAGTGRRPPAAPLDLSAQLVVFLDQTGEFALDLVQEGVDLLLVVPPLADRGLFKGHVVHVGRGERHRNSSGQLRPRRAVVIVVADSVIRRA